MFGVSVVDSFEFCSIYLFVLILAAVHWQIYSLESYEGQTVATARYKYTQ